MIGWRMRTNSPWLLNAVASRTTLPPEGLGGGAPGAAGRFLVNGKTVTEARKMAMQPDDEVTLETPGGGGYGGRARRPAPEFAALVFHRSSGVLDSSGRFCDQLLRPSSQSTPSCRQNENRPIYQPSDRCAGPQRFRRWNYVARDRAARIGLVPAVAA